MKYAKKHLGQNFLHSTTIRQNIVDAAGEIADKNVLEIGPGLGFLTTSLLKSKANLTAVELDERNVRTLQADLGHKPNFKLIQGDILQQDLDQMFGTNSYQVIANIPYNITSPIIRKLFSETKNKPTNAILMVQKEVAERIVNTKKKTMLSLSVEIFGEARIICQVNRTEFNPIPGVDSAVIQITTRPEPLISPSDEADFFTVVHGGLSNKRKKIGNYIGGYFGTTNDLLLGDIDPNRRAEGFTVDEWITVMRNFQNNVK